MYLDLDAEDVAARVFEVADGNRAALPNVRVVRRASGHAAAAWFLDEPVHKYPGVRDKPQQLFRHVPSRADLL